MRYFEYSQLILVIYPDNLRLSEKINIDSIIKIFQKKINKLLFTYRLKSSSHKAFENSIILLKLLQKSQLLKNKTSEILLIKITIERKNYKQLNTNQIRGSPRFMFYSLKMIYD